MKRVLLFGLISLLGLQLMFCTEQTVSPQIEYESELNVFALLVLNNQQKTIRVERSYRIDEFIPESTGITNAQVTIQSDNQTVQFYHTQNGNYRDVGNKLRLIPGAKYSLEVEVPDGRKINGTCVMPNHPKIVRPQTQEKVLANRALEVNWQAADYAHRYVCILTDLEKEFTPIHYSDSTATTFFAFFFADPNVYTLKVAACDQNYYDHIRTNENDEGIIHLKGGVGVFGALAYDQVTFIAE